MCDESALAHSYSECSSLSKLCLRSSSHSASMKKLTMSIVAGAISKYRNVSLKNTWLKLPSVRSFDVIAVRPITQSMGVNTYLDSTISGYQKYKSNGYIRYSYGSDHIKIVSGKGKCGIGLSTNLKDNATLKKSKKYSFGPTGYGGVLIFKDSVKDKYDKMQGVHVLGAN